MVQPPRGFGENPVAIYHDPDLPPCHHYLGAYRWLAAPQDEGGFGADAIVHLGKHGNLEWLPGKTLGMSASCGTDAALGDLPLVYPFLVNDPGEGTQAKRRAHATLVDHLIPPMARAETYGDISRLEQLLDEHANISALDPAKLPAIRQQIWTLMQAAKLDHDLGLEERPARGRVRRLPAARRRLALRDQGRPDPRRPARARRRAGRRPARGPRARDAARPPDVGRRAEPARPARGPGPARRRPEGPRRRGRGARARPRRGHGGRRLEPGRRPDGRRRRVPEPRIRAAERADSRGNPRESARIGERKHDLGTARPSRSSGCCGSRRRRSSRGSTGPPTRSRASCTRSTAGSSRPGRPGRRCAAWSTCSRPAATSTPSTPRPSRRGSPGRPGRRWRSRWSSATGATTTARTRRASASACGARAPCARPATTSPRSSPCSASGRSGTRCRAGSPGSR